MKTIGVMICLVLMILMCSCGSSAVSTVSVTFYWYDELPFDYDDFNLMSSAEVELPADHLNAEFIRLIKEYSGISIDGIWYEGKRLCADLAEEEARSFNMGSATGITRSNVLIATLSTMPDVEEIEILINGQRGCFADHYNFDRIFEKVI